jgi:hypothetical protein
MPKFWVLDIFYCAKTKKAWRLLLRLLPLLLFLLLLKLCIILFSCCAGALSNPRTNTTILCYCSASYPQRIATASSPRLIFFSNCAPERIANEIVASRRCKSRCVSRVYSPHVFLSKQRENSRKQTGLPRQVAVGRVSGVAKCY